MMKPFSFHQKVTWVLFAINILFEGWLVCLLKRYQLQVWHWSLSLAIFICLNLLIALYAFITARIDPSDKTVRIERYMNLTNQNFEDDEFEFYCYICEAHVCEFTKHCGRCHRCCYEFDHHCLWLNNCVGSRNYRYFFILIALVVVQAVVHELIGSYCLVKFLHVNEITFFHVNTKEQIVYQCLFIAQIAINFVIFFCSTVLLTYHIWLKLNNKTTYSHILEKRV